MRRRKVVVGLGLKTALGCGILFDVGEWRSLEAHLHGVQGAAGSNPVSPTIYDGGGSQESLPLCKMPFSAHAQRRPSAGLDLALQSAQSDWSGARRPFWRL